MNEKLTDAQLGQIVGAIRAMETEREKEARHHCQFSAVEEQRAHVFFQMFDDKAQDSFRNLIKFGARIDMLVNAGWVAFAVAFVGGLISAVVIGIRAKLNGGATP